MPLAGLLYRLQCSITFPHATFSEVVDLDMARKWECFGPKQARIKILNTSVPAFHPFFNPTVYCFTKQACKNNLVQIFKHAWYQRQPLIERKDKKSKVLKQDRTIAIPTG